MRPSIAPHIPSQKENPRSLVVTGVSVSPNECVNRMAGRRQRIYGFMFERNVFYSNGVLMTYLPRWFYMRSPDFCLQAVIKALTFQSDKLF